jgi:diketogulonate reductase-like aldo/keto reductase
MNKRMLSRREFNALCTTIGFASPAVPSVVVAEQSGIRALGVEASTPTGHILRFGNGIIVPAVGQGTWHIGQQRHPADVEEEALRTGISLGMTLIDTSGNYGEGRSEELISHVIAGQRDRVFLVSKVETNQVSGNGIARACRASLSRLGTNYVDLYLLHWPVPSSQLSGTVAAFEQLRAERKIRAWGVSNFNVSQMEDLFRVSDGHRCATNQVGYSLNNRGNESDILPWCKRHNIPVMAYSPLGGDNNLLIRDRALTQIGASHDCSAAAVALAWVIRDGNVIAIPESGAPAHVKENAVALSLALTPQDLQTLEAAYPARARAN